MNQETLDRMPEWQRILRKAVMEYQEDDETNPDHQISKKQEVL